ncbi:MAG: DUF6562 domain-containing protein, partial [Alistipes sp.]|nr:DUF6562 domain-containing protein [Alistipes sp.]
MKKLFLFAVAAFAMLATSCSKDADVITPSEEGVVTFSVAAPQLSTRAKIGDGETATTLHYAVYDENWNHLEAFYGTKPISISTTVQFDLVDGKTYNFLFWAQNAAAPYTFNPDTKKVTVDYAGIKSNNEQLDAFFAPVEGVKVSASLPQQDVDLYRPFAQLNIATSDWDKFTASEETFSNTEVKVYAYDTLDLVSGDVANGLERTFTMNTMVTEAFAYDGTNYKWLSMNYLLIDGKELVKVTFNANNTDVEEKTWNNVPVERNYRTNIVGSLLTSTTDFKITIRPDFEKPDYVVPEFTDKSNFAMIGDKEYKTLDEAIAAAYDGDVIILAEGEATLPAGITTNGTRASSERTLTFMGSGIDKTILKGRVGGGNNPGNYANELHLIFKNLTHETANSGYSGGFGHTASVVMDGCKLVGQFYAHSDAPHKFINCTIDPLNGYLYTYASDVDFENCVFEASEGKALQVYEDSSVGENTVNINNCTFKAAKVGYTYSGKPVTAIDMNSNGATFHVNINNCTATGFGKGEYSNSTLWNIKGGFDKFDVKIDGVNPDLYAQMQVENAVVELPAGEYTVPSSIANNVTLKGENAEDVIVNVKSAVALSSKSVNFESLTVNYAENSTYVGFHHVAAENYKDCIIKGQMFLYGVAQFDNCTFITEDPNNYNVWTYGAAKATFNNCKFYSAGKSVLIYNENGAESKVTFNDCTLDATAPVAGKAAIEIDSSLFKNGKKFVVNINGCDARGFANGSVSGNPLWNEKKGNNSAIFVDGVAYTQLAFALAVAEGNDNVKLGAGTYVVPAAQGKTISFTGVGNREDVRIVVTKVGTGGENCDYGLDSSNATFENLTIATNSSTYIGYARCTGTYKNCLFDGTYTLYQKSVFEGCTFNVAGDVYNVWTWGSEEATFTDCVFNCDGKAMLLYGPANTHLTMNDCTFNDNGGLADLKAAIEIGNDYNMSYNLVVNNATVNGFEINDKGIVTNTTLWANKNSMGQDKLNVVVDGVDVY